MICKVNDIDQVKNHCLGTFNAMMMPILNNKGRKHCRQRPFEKTFLRILAAPLAYDPKLVITEIRTKRLECDDKDKNVRQLGGIQRIKLQSRRLLFESHIW